MHWPRWGYTQLSFVALILGHFFYRYRSVNNTAVTVTIAGCKYISFYCYRTVSYGVRTTLIRQFWRLMLLNQLSRALYEIRSTQKTNLFIYIYIYIYFFSRKFISPTKPSLLIAIITAYIMIVIIIIIIVIINNNTTTTTSSFLTSPFVAFTYLCLFISELFLDTSTARSSPFRRTHSSTGEVEVIKLLSFVGWNYA